MSKVQCWDVVEDAADSNDAEAYEVEVDKITMEIRVSVKFENYPTRIFFSQAFGRE